MEYKYNNLINNNHGTILFMTLLILTTMLTVILVAANLVMAGLIMSRTQENSTISYAAAEAGAERVLWAIRIQNNSEDLMRVYTEGSEEDCVEGDYINFNTDPAKCVDDIDIFVCGVGGGDSCLYPLPDNPEAQYIVRYSKEGDDTVFTSKGIYRGLSRSVEVGFTKEEGPSGCDQGINCLNLNCGDDDGCSGFCPTKCLYQPGCEVGGPSDPNSEVVGDAGFCCGGETCYKCQSGYVWDYTNKICCDATCGDTGLGFEAGGCYINPPSDGAKLDDNIPPGDCCNNGSCWICDSGWSWNADNEECDCAGTCDPAVVGTIGCSGSSIAGAKPHESEWCCLGETCYVCKPGFHEEAGQCVLDDTNLIAWWKMDDDPNDGDGVLDSAGGYNGTNSVIGATLVDGSFPGNCKSGNCLNFDGNDNNVNVSNIWGELVGDCKRYGTIATWFWWDGIDFNQNRHIFHFKRDNENMLRIFYDSGSNVWRVEYVGQALSRTVDIPRASGFVKLGWNHLVMTWDDDDGDTEADLIFYINGEAVGSQPSIDNFLGFLSGSVCKLGSKSADAQYLLGRLDEFRVYCSRTLNAVEVAALCEFDNGVDCCELRGPGACP